MDTGLHKELLDRAKELREKEKRLNEVIEWAESEQEGNPCSLEYASGVDRAKRHVLKIAKGESNG